MDGFGRRDDYVLVAVALAAAAIAGCGEKPRPLAALDAGELLDLIQAQQPHDPRNYVEVDLGRFKATHRLPSGEGHIYVQFHLYGVLPPQKLAKLNEALPLYEKRIRDAVIGLVQRTDIEQLTEPSLAFFKSEVVATINRVLQEQLLAEVAFSDYSTDRDAGMPWSPAAVAPKPAGGHGH